MAIAILISMALGAALPAQQVFDIAKVPDLCSGDPAAAMRIDSKHGATATYVLQEAPYKSGSQAFTGVLDGDLVTGSVIESNLFSLIFIRTRAPIFSAEQMRVQISRLCALRRDPRAKLALFASQSGAERKRVERRLARGERRRAASRAAAAAEAQRRKQLAALMRTLPDVAEIDAVVRLAWSDAPDAFGYGDTARLGRVRDAKCRRAGVVFRCRIGVTAIVAGEPQYEQSDVEFLRDAAGKLQLSLPEIVIT